MSKMPAKKKSCFQITSVTQAQVAAVGAADDTESLDDPDESRTEDMSSEIYDVSRAEYEPACERSSSDEALNNVGEAEAPANAPQATPPPGPGGNTTELRKVAGSGSVHGGQNQLGITPTPGLPLMTPSGSSSATSTVSCSSRFRVIKLDHGTGEPFRRGRWMCTEFYEKDSGTDSIRHGSVTLDPAAERDSGLGPSVGSTVSPATHSGPGLGSMAEGSHSSLLPQVLHQSYSSQQHAGSTLATHTSFSSVQPVTLPSQSSIGGLQPHAAQSVLPVGQNGLPHSEVHIQKSPMMPPPYVPQQPVPGVHLITSQSSGLAQHQKEYYPQPQPASIPAGLPGGQQALPASSLSAASGGHIPTPASGLQTASQYAPAVQPQPMGHPAATGVQNVPAVGVGSSAPVLSASSATMPNATTSSLPPGLIAHTKTPGILGVQGLPATGFGQLEVLSSLTGSLSTVAFLPVRSSVQKHRTYAKTDTFTELKKPKLTETISGLPWSNMNSVFLPSQSVISDIFSQIKIEEMSHTFFSSFMVNPRRSIAATTDQTLISSLRCVIFNFLFNGNTTSASGTNIVAIDNKIEQAMDLVKSHLMYAVREEVEVLKEQIKELFERNSVLERENAVLKSLANSEQLSQLTAQTGATSAVAAAAAAATPGSTSTQLDAGQQPQPNVTSA
uniref:TSC22 domain family member 2 n=1 Tax=Poecilia formosa TaxID=48698 RepID=A0A096LVM6_POEFO